MSTQHQTEYSDQRSVVVRDVRVNDTPCEHFLGFLKNTGHKSEQLAKAVFEFLRNHDINLDDCRGQLYDNAANMSGPYSDLQARMN